jgi:hypothetical protein
MAEGDRARAVANVITTDDEYEQAGIVLRDVRKNKQAGLEEFDAIYEPLWEAVKALRKRKAEVIGPWEEAEQSLRDAMTEFHAARTARVETERLDAAEAAMAGIDEVTDPDEILERAATAKAELQKIQTPEKQPDGISYRDHWVAEVVNVRALALAVGAGEEDEDLINPNMKRLHELARALRTKFTIPGVIAKNRPVLQVRGR